jgi:hypothetical protein
LLLVGNFNLNAQTDCLPEPEMQGILPPPPMSQYCEDEEGHTVFFQFANINLGSYCDMTLVANGTDPHGNIINNSEMRLWDYMEALLDECAREDLCTGGYWDLSTPSIKISDIDFFTCENCGNTSKIYVHNGLGAYTGSDLDLHYDWLKWTSQNWKISNLPNPSRLCSGISCGKWLIDDFEIIDRVNPIDGKSILNLTVTYKLACCPCDTDDNNNDDFPPDLGNGNE